ncbi:hypothetical protein ACFV9C_44285 [Kribbella sp. NPDC059898]|uniref:hypothetical protein n=1 Tax=Kribbella sp. NPDC059898 TaxID=3346995 RepID=UPI003669FC4F
MITKVSDSPCWVVRFDAEDTLGHFLTAQAAAEFVDRYGSRYGDPYQLGVPCWTATCDTEVCDEVEASEDGDAVHIPALNSRHALVDLQDLKSVGRDLLCWECRQAFELSTDPSEPPAIVTHDDVERLIGIVAAFAEQIQPWRDPSTRRFVTRFAAMTALVPNGLERWSVKVRPFVLQPLLPDMPAVAATTEVAR